MSRNGAIFVRSNVDDYGLTPIQFRIYCHIARRAGQDGCFASVESMAKICRVNRNSIWPALRFLKDHRLIEAIRRPGDTTVYKITPISAWLPHANPPQNNSLVGRPKIHQTSAKAATHSKVIADTRPKIRGTHPPQNNSHKGSPYEGTPIQGTPEESGFLQTPTAHQEKSIRTKKRLPTVADVLKFALTKAGCRKLVDKWLTPNLNRILKQSAKSTIDSQSKEDARDALERAFRFIHYNNRKGWTLTDSWQSAYTGFTEKADHGAGPAAVPVDWIPKIEIPVNGPITDQVKASWVEGEEDCPF